MDFERLAFVRPYLFHLTARENLPTILEEGTLYPAADLLKEAGAKQWLRARRPEHVRVRRNGTTLVIRDQQPLHPGNIDLGGGYTYEDVLRDVNERVFFWPGTEERGPVRSGHNHFRRYESEKPVILRVALSTLIAANARGKVEVCQYNSGAPRCSGGRKSPRGPDTFLAPERFPLTPSRVVEVVVRGRCGLPSRVDVGASPAGPWKTHRLAS